MSKLKHSLRDALAWSRRLLKPGVPVILQDEMSECAMASIAMIASYYGKALTLRQMRQNYTVARDGMSLFQIIKVCEELALVSRPLKLMLYEIKQLKTPSILFWNNMHFVVLEAVTRKGLHIVDPATGRRFYTWEEALPLFSGVALEVVPGLNFTVCTQKKSRARLGFINVFKVNPWLMRYLAPMALLSIVVYLVGISAPKLFSLTIDEVVAKNDQDFLYLILFIFGGLFLFKVIAALLRTWLDVQIRVALSQDLSVGVISWLLRLPVRYFERRAPADILRRTHAVDKAYTQFTSGWMDMIIDSVFGLIFLVLMTWINPQLAMLSMGLCGVFFIFRLLSLPLMEKQHKASIEAETARNITLLGAIHNVETMKLYNYEAQKLANWSNQQAQTETTRANVQRLQAMNQVVHDGLGHGHSLLVCALGAMAVLHGENSVGDLFAFVLYKDMLMDCAFKVVERYTNLRLVKVDLARVDEIIDESPDAVESSVYSSSPITRSETITSIRVEAGLFRYSSFENPIFENVYIAVEDCKKIAVYGPSGCGKSTLLKTLAGFYSLDGGRIRVNGMSMHHFGLRRYRQHVAYVTANDELVASTVIDNIVMDNDGFDGEHLQRCVEQAGLLSSIVQLSNGFNTLLGPTGVQLSSGQKQRLLIARALYRKPHVLLLDEPTSHLDIASRDVIIETLGKLPMLCVIVTHDMAVARACDVILEMTEGRLKPVYRRKP